MDGNPFRLVVFDLDGTVLTQGANALTARTVEALNCVKAMDCTVAVATGRSEVIIPDAVLDLPFLDYLITCNGARLTDHRTAECLFHAALPRETAWDIVTRERERAAFNLFFPGRAVMEERCVTYMLPCEATASEAERRNLAEVRATTQSVEDIRAVLGPGAPEVEKLGCTYPTPQAARAALPALQGRGDVEAALVMDNEIEITPAGVHKGRALGLLRKRLGLPLEAVLAFGDSGNDLSLRRSAGFLVAMGNAAAELKRVADAVAPSVEEDGVARFLEALPAGKAFF